MEFFEMSFNFLTFFVKTEDDEKCRFSRTKRQID